MITKQQDVTSSKNLVFLSEAIMGGLYSFNNKVVVVGFYVGGSRVYRVLRELDGRIITNNHYAVLRMLELNPTKWRVGAVYVHRDTGLFFRVCEPETDTQMARVMGIGVAGNSAGDFKVTTKEVYDKYHLVEVLHRVKFLFVNDLVPVKEYH